MNPELIAKITVITEDHKSIGTGYPINSEYVITAYHVTEKAKKINVKWESIIDPTTEKAYSVDVEENILIPCIDDNGEEDGVALLRCKVPKQVEESPLILAESSPPRDKIYWDSIGYPKFAQNTKKSMMGEMLFQDMNPIVDITNKCKIKKKKGWAGVSGAPIFQEHILYAINIEMLEDVKNEFRAISIPWLLKNKTEDLQKIGVISSKAYNKYLFFLEEKIMACLSDIQETTLYYSLAEKFVSTEIVKPEILFKKFNQEIQKNKANFFRKFTFATEKDIFAKKLNIDVARKLFVLLLGLTAPKYQNINSSIHHLAVRTQTLAELHLAAFYQLPPNLIQTNFKGVNKRNSIVGKHIIEVIGEAIGEETGIEGGWKSRQVTKDLVEIVNTAIKKTHKKIYNDSIELPNADAVEELDQTLLRRRDPNGLEPELNRFEIAYPKKEEDRIHPLNNNEICKEIQKELPSLPIARYGFDNAEQETELRVEVNEFFFIIQKYS